MRLIQIDEYNEAHMQLAKPIYDKQRRILLAAGRTIHPSYLQRLKLLNIRYLFVEDAISFGISMEEMLEMPTWMDAIECVQKAYEAVKKKQALPYRELQSLASKLVVEVGSHKAVILIPTTSLAEELRLFAHVVNTTLLTIQLGIKRHYRQALMKDLALGTLLHDIGKFISSHEGDHTISGFQFLRKVREMSLLAAHVAYQHHEHFDGSGTSRGISGEEIHEFAQICAIANTYEHLISDSGMPPHEAMEYIMTQNGKMFSPYLVTLFVQEMPSYIPGTRVRLNNDREAIVTKILSNRQRPYIRYLDTKEEISLADHHTLLIKELIVN